MICDGLLKALRVFSPEEQALPAGTEEIRRGLYLAADGTDL